MPDDTEPLLRRLIGGDAPARTEILDRAPTSSTPALLVAAALLAPEPAPLLDRADAHAASTRDRQLVAVARAHVAGDDELLDALVRDHLADHPDNLLAAWIAGQQRDPGPTPVPPTA